MPAPDQSTINTLRTAYLSLGNALKPLDADDPIREKIEDAQGHVDHIIRELKRLRDNK